MRADGEREARRFEDDSLPRHGPRQDRDGGEPGSQGKTPVALAQGRTRKTAREVLQGTRQVVRNREGEGNVERRGRGQRERADSRPGQAPDEVQTGRVRRNRVRRGPARGRSDVPEDPRILQAEKTRRSDGHAEARGRTSAHGLVRRHMLRTRPQVGNRERIPVEASMREGVVRLRHEQCRQGSRRLHGERSRGRDGGL